ncbi:hypothetical protein JADG_008662 [Aureobasidium aubasidani]|nr:hypothetical protein JADG_008662 [Aureobasidium pullulans]
MEDSSEQQHPATFDSMPMSTRVYGFWLGITTASNAFVHLFAIATVEAKSSTVATIDDAMAEYAGEPTDILSTTSTADSNWHDISSYYDADISGRMCKYAEENPTAKQTEIGYLFGVERSTVSKVLRKKEIYLNQSQPKETPRSPPNKRSKARLPDIEKTLSAWVIKEQKKGSPITDDAIREQAYYFASIPGPENPASNPVNIPGWLEKFKQKHHVNRAFKSKELRKDSVADSDNATVQSPTSPSDENLSSSSPETIYPTMDTAMAAEDAKPNNSNKRRKSPPSINTAFTDIGSTSTCFTPQLLSPTSPFFSPSSQISAGPLHSPLSQQQTFPALDHFMADSSPAEETLSSSSHPFLSSLGNTEDAESGLGRLGSIDEYMEDVIIDSKTINPDALTAKAPTREEAREALKIVVRYLEGEDGGRSEVQEGKLLGKLLGEKLRLRE